MNNFKYNNKLISLLTSSMLVLTCCSCTSNKMDTNVTSDTIKYSENTTSAIQNTEQAVNVLTEETATYTEVSQSESVTSSIMDTYTEVSNDYTKEENMILEYFDSLGNEIKSYIDSKELPEKGKAYFICCVDFLFFDEPINGVRFSELRDSVKQQLLENINSIDELICSKYPNYKEEISDKYSYIYNKAGEIIKAGSNNIQDFSKEKLGEKKYNELNDSKDEFKEQIKEDFDDVSDLANEGKEKVKSWYQEFKNN